MGLVDVWGSTELPEGVTGTPLDTGVTAEQKLDAINGWTVAGPRRDVPVAEVTAHLLLSGAIVQLLGFAGQDPTGDPTHDMALHVAKIFTTWINLGPNAPAVRCSDPETYSKITAMLGALVAQESAEANSTGITQDICNEILALAETTTPWWKSVGYQSPLALGDVIAAGLS